MQVLFTSFLQSGCPALERFDVGSASPGHYAWSYNTLTAVFVLQANRTGVLVHKLMTKTSNSHVREELELFSMQLLHSKVRFTACGFFPLDFTLLYSIVGAVTTYLVILIQFQQTFTTSSNSTLTTTEPSI
ncbi:hypothetical protein L9F63_001636 [Diploptera punctata]|uniref:Gustatory receptor n=1 Tax=Diploptera punctata TaxID=6984 RepID=A0AAD8A3K3_DIPPU|nr:hypothetical protein L9F63_001636 [Diploptera punctata]